MTGRRTLIQQAAAAPPVTAESLYFLEHSADASITKIAYTDSCVFAGKLVVIGDCVKSLFRTLVIRVFNITTLALESQYEYETGALGIVMDRSLVDGDLYLAGVQRKTGSAQVQNLIMRFNSSFTLVSSLSWVDSATGNWNLFTDTETSVGFDSDGTHLYHGVQSLSPATGMLISKIPLDLSTVTASLFIAHNQRLAAFKSHPTDGNFYFTTHGGWVFKLDSALTPLVARWTDSGSGDFIFAGDGLSFYKAGQGGAGFYPSITQVRTSDLFVLKSFAVTPTNGFRGFENPTIEFFNGQLFYVGGQRDLAASGPPMLFSADLALTAVARKDLVHNTVTTTKISGFRGSVFLPDGRLVCVGSMESSHSVGSPAGILVALDQTTAIPQPARPACDTSVTAEDYSGVASTSVPGGALTSPTQATTITYPTDPITATTILSTTIGPCAWEAIP